MLVYTCFHVFSAHFYPHYIIMVKGLLLLLTFFEVSVIHIQALLFGLPLQSEVVRKFALVPLGALALLEEEAEDRFGVGPGRDLLDLNRSEDCTYLHALLLGISLLFLWVSE